MKKTKPELVDRLRYAAETAPPAVAALMQEAAAEIEELRRVLDISDPMVLDDVDEIELLIMEPMGSA